MTPPLDPTLAAGPAPTSAARTAPVRGCAWALAAALVLAACSSSPPYQLYQLRAEPPAGVSSASTPGPRTSAVWTVGPVALPEYLDRDAILVPTGQAGLAALPLQRWAEPLRDAIPRILRQDLARLRGVDQVWAHPAPTGVAASRQLRLEVQHFGPRDDGRTVELRARWWLQDSQTGALAGGVQQHSFSAQVPPGAGTDGLVATMRALLWEMAGRMSEPLADRGK